MLLGNNLLSRHLSLLQKYGGATWSRTKNVYHEGTDLQSADAHAIASIAPYLVDRGRIELPTEACKATVIPFNYQPKFFGDPERIWTSDIWFWRPTFCRTELRSHNTLFPMCVLKYSKLLRLPVRKECFNTLGFFYVQEHKPSPRPPICSLEWYRLALPLH